MAVDTQGRMVAFAKSLAEGVDRQEEPSYPSLRLSTGTRETPALGRTRAGFSYARVTPELARLFLRFRHIRNVERFASFRQRDPRIPLARIVFAL